MNNHLIFSVLVSIILVSCDYLRKPTGNLNNWTDIGKNIDENFRPLGIISDDNILISFGYTSETYDCGFLGLGNCRDFLIYKSQDYGETWQVVSNDLISKRHKLVKGDKLNPEYLKLLSKKYGESLKLGKQIYDFVQYNDFLSKGKLFNDSGTYYLYQDLTMYTSSDEGHTWEEVEITNNFVLPIITYSVIDIVDGYLVVHSSDTQEKTVYKRSEDEFIPTTHEDFYLYYDSEGQKEILFEGENKYAHRMTNAVNSDGTLYVKKMVVY